MHAIPEKLNTLRQQMEATMIRRLHDQREELEQKMAESCRSTQEEAIRLTSEQLHPYMKEVEKKLQARLDQVQLQTDQAPPRIQEVLEMLMALKNEVTPLHSRADAAAARLDRLGVQSATTSKDCSTLSQDFTDSMDELRGALKEQETRRNQLEEALRELIRDTSDSLGRANQAAVERADKQCYMQTAQCENLEERLRKSLAELEERARAEANLGDENVINKLMPEVQTVEALIRRRTEECNGQAERLTNNTGAKLREELDTACKRVTAINEQLVDRKARELALMLDQGLAMANRLTEGVREGADTSLRDQILGVRNSLADGLAESAQNLESLRQQVVAVETRSLQSIEHAKSTLLDTTSTKLDEMVKALRRDMDTNQRGAAQDDETLRQDVLRLLTQESSRLEKAIEEMGSNCNHTAEASVGVCNAQLREQLTKAIREANERTDAARCAAADALSKEVQSRQACMLSSDQSRETLAKNLRDELHGVASDAEKRLQNSVMSIDQRIHAANQALKALEVALQADEKHLVETTTSLRAQLKSERQLTEEQEADAGRRLAQTRDSLETRIQSEASDIRKMLGDCQKKIHDEAAEIRSEMREKANKKEVQDMGRTSADRCNEVTTMLDSHRIRLEESVGDFAARYREVRQEANESRLRGQREAIALGGEVTQLRAASSSLMNGVLKAFQVVGLLARDEHVTEMHSSGATTERAFAPGSPSGGSTTIDGGVSRRGFEVEDLLKWEKSGRSLASRVERNWYKQEMAGIPNMMAMVHRKLELGEEDVSRLRSVLGADWSPESTSIMNSRPVNGFASGLSTMTSPLDRIGGVSSPGPLLPTAPRPPHTAPARPPQGYKDFRTKQATALT
eukprot:TRINITY_DN11138_c0_g1_i1.p1 TRINITY_DN11138_c0_g1~~TRINITY_DN11138_c0_g1_i1.p1  ORF type:complete len:861 (-),score=217.86 TRINITY_DN11138_c0_g1_i1:103-2685(-)